MQGSDRVTTMARVFRTDEIDPEIIKGKQVAMLGYGSQGSAQALNLRDSGVSVVVGLYEGSRSKESAESEDLVVTGVREAVDTSDVLVFALPDVQMSSIYHGQVAGSLRDGQTMVFVHGFNIRYDLIQAPPGVDVVLVSPKGVGPGVRKKYVEGSGVPALVAVHQDATGTALATALSYAWGLGCAHSGIMETTFKEETETDLFGEQAVLCGGMIELIKAGYDTLVEAGYQPEAAYFECLHETKLITDLLIERGISGMRAKISDTAEWGGYVSGPRIIGDAARTAMREILQEIQDGAFTREWIAEVDTGGRRLAKFREQGATHPIEQTGAAVREMIGGKH
jgi:ketol-acid reductoisomerase